MTTITATGDAAACQEFSSLGATGIPFTDHHSGHGRWKDFFQGWAIRVFF